VIAVQSLWTRTPQWRLSRGQLLLQTLTLCALRRHFDFVELVSDECGILIADRLRWNYDSFRTDLEFIPDEIAHIWAAGKLVAQRIQSEPYAHIDNDFVLLDPLPAACRQAPVFAQGKDEPAYYLNPHHAAVFALAGLPRGAVGYNAGIIGGTDLRALHGYCDYAYGLMEKCASYGNGTVASIIVEQAGFGHYMRAIRCPVVELIPLPLSASNGDFSHCRFSHLWAWTKRQATWQAKVERRMIEEFPAEYARFNAGYAKLGDVLAHPRRVHVKRAMGLPNGTLNGRPTSTPTPAHETTPHLSRVR